MKAGKELLEELKTLITQADSPEQAIDNIIKAYPEIDAETLRNQFKASTKQAEQMVAEQRTSEITQDLSEEELAEIAGGSFGSWMKKNWPYVLGAAVIITGGLAIGIKQGSNLYSSDEISSAKEAATALGKVEGYDNGMFIGTETGNTVVGAVNKPDWRETWQDAAAILKRRV
ncbi:hypothetical protein MSI_05460 [Treponema sp. JC4]|uniref:hypothetical protein n=1 Tax=Treponema sp. JC4 TaxID=1124982 RepID=UPI00025B0A17|nr:hypothetical protein [Treponema sp. JC4]EID85727.1 hypothetical protein MSI_05460 [Treponema sp. JC4]